MNAICQRCGRRDLEWTIRQAQLHVGDIEWKVQLCRTCTDVLQQAIAALLPPMTREPLPSAEDVRGILGKTAECSDA